MNSRVTTTVTAVDQTFLITFSLAAFFFVLIVVFMLVFIYRYHHTKHPEAADIRGNTLLEIAWIVIPSFVALGMFYSGWQSYLTLQNAPKNALSVSVTAKKWAWTFSYPNGRISNILYVPLNKPVRLSLTSADVLHSFYAPAFRIKRDTVPRMTTYAWFLPDSEGEFDVMCAEYCGFGHSAMVTKIRVLRPETFYDWYEHGTIPGEPPGLEVYVKHGCIGCHPTGGMDGVGPSLQGIFGTQQKVVRNGKPMTVTVD
ncbi:MAG TPA: cytochrome c oxidase subunit II, partial [Thermodesulfobacteriota bacterium]|nr:cytochrome c oxidase subunit II [Thermodesulfobacteriota bacterium]